MSRIETTDGRYLKISDDEWWDVRGVEIVDDDAVGGYMIANAVGWVVIEIPVVSVH